MIHVGVGISAYMSHALFGFHETAVCEGGVIGFALGSARVGYVVDSTERSTTDIVADPMGSLEHASVITEYQMC